MNLPVHPAPLEPDQVRVIQLAVLSDFAEVCERFGYRWWLCAGTLLGAVRHGGFIPWDDDVDVAMPRADYERFCANAEALPTGRALASMNTDPNYCFPFAKVYDSGTRVTEAYRPMPTYGVGIDVFPVDSWPDKGRRPSLVFGLKLLRGLLGLHIIRPRPEWGFLRRSVAKTGHTLLRPVPPQFFARVLTSVVVRSGRCGSPQGVVVWGYEEKVNAAAFADDVLLDFEGVARPAPTGWDEWLTACYGDYRTPPPVRDRVGHAHLTAYRL